MPQDSVGFFSVLWNPLTTLLRFLQHEPELALFLAIGIGFYIGQKKIGPVQLGGVCGTLLTALILGQSGVAIDPSVKNLFFAIFIFALGYLGGPQFFSSLNAKGLRLGLFSLVEVVAVLSLALAIMHLFQFDPGTTAGMVAGSATESAVIGTASEAISRLPLDSETLRSMQANVATAYSLTYIFGLITIVVFTSQIAPLLLRKSLQQEATELWEKLGGNSLAAPDSAEAMADMTGRIYSVTVGAGKTVEEVEKLVGPGARIERIRRGKSVMDAGPFFMLRKGDLVLVMGHRAVVFKAQTVLGEERPAGASLNMVMETEQYRVNGKKSAGLGLAELFRAINSLELDGHVYIASVTRNGAAMPLAPRLALQKGDSVNLTGARADVEKAGALIGPVIKTGVKTSFVYVGVGIVLGILIGRISVPLGSVALSLGTGGGALLTGLLFGWFQAWRPEIPATSPAALEIMKDLGLAAFVACIGLSSGKQAVALVGQYGLVLPLAGITIALVPALISLIVGHFLLKLELPVLLGGIAGQQCSTPALSAVQAAAGNTTPLIGYTITYAISNVLLPLLGPIIVGLAYAK